MPNDDPFFHDLRKEWIASGSMFDFNDGVGRMAFSYSAQVSMNRKLSHKHPPLLPHVVLFPPNNSSHRFQISSVTEMTMI